MIKLLKNPLVLFIAIFATAVFTRLPQLLSPYFILNGDECVIAIMTKHFSQGKDFSLFMHGSSYCLAGFDALIGAIWVKLFGLSDIGLKLTQLLIWSAGLHFLFLAVRRWFGEWVGYFSLLLLLFMSAWASMSMRMLGCYANSFLFVNMTLYAFSVIDTSAARKPWHWFSAGILIELTFASQPLFVFCVLPFAIYMLYKKEEAWNIALLLFGIAGTRAAVIFMTAHDIVVWSKPQVESFNSPAILLKLVERLIRCFSGSYAMINYCYGVFRHLSGILWTAITLYIFVAHALRYREENTSSWLFLGAAVSIIAVTLLLKPGAYGYMDRYLLPLAGLIAPIFAYRLSRLPLRARPYVLALVLAVSTCALIEFRWLPSQMTYYPTILSEKYEKKKLTHLLQELKNNNIRYIYCNDGILQWIFMYYSHEEIVARWILTIDRYPAYPASVDAAFIRGEPVALVGIVKAGRSYNLIGADPADIKIIDNRYFIIYNPSRKLLEENHFKFV